MNCSFNNMTRVFTAAVALFLISANVHGQGAEFSAVAEGKAASVVLLPESGQVAADAAYDLALTLSKMSGKDFKLATDIKEEPCIVVGLASEWEKTAKDKIPAERLKSAGSEGFLLLSSQKRLLILGKTSEGVSHGVYTLLRDLGCRWYFPASDWSVIPSKKEIKINVDRVEGPAMKVRILSNGAGLGASARQFKDWCRRNRLGSEYGQNGVSHSYANFVPKTLFKDHPEYFAKVSKDGEAPGTEQNGNQPCTTNPEVVKMVKEACMSRLRQMKEEGRVPKMISVSPNDGTPNMCRCENCMKVGSYGDCTLLLANQVAEEIQKEFPDTLVGFLAYGRASALPLNVKANPQVLASIAAGYNWKTSVPRLIDGWSKIVRHATIYEYYAIGASGSWRPDSNSAKIKDMALSLSAWNKKGIEGVNGEIENDWGSCGHRFWAFAELAWNPSLKPDALMDDFLSNCWGPAVDPMRRYYQRWESGQEANPRTLALSVADLQTAAKLAANAPDVLKRIDQLSVFLYWNQLKNEYALTKDDENLQAQIALEGDILQYRMRDYLMVQLVGSIYKVDRPVPFGFTALEVAAIRKKMADKLAVSGSAVELLGPASSENLVPMDGNSKKMSAASSTAPAVFISTASYRFRAKAGETVNVRFDAEPSRAGVKAAEAKKGDGIEDAEKDPEEALGRFQLWSLGAVGDALEFVQEESPVAKDGTAQLKFQIPSEGLYQINVKTKKFGVREDFRGRAYVVVADAKNRINVMTFEKKESQLPAGEKNQYGISYFFYVPKNTKNFLVRAFAGAEFIAEFLPLNENKPVANASVKSRTEMIIAVPPGKDGCVWELRMNAKSCKFGLDGVPPFLSRNPSELLVPKEHITR